MKIALICPSNKMYMPYLDNYESIIKLEQANYEILLWDRFHIEDVENKNVYRDLKIGHRRNYYDYLKYKRFILEKLNKNKYDKVVVFGLQLSHFLYRYLIRNYSDNFIVDIRDYNKIAKFTNLNRLIEESTFTVISSDGYRKWLPSSNKLIVNHNTKFNNIDDLKRTEIIESPKNLSISYIGSLRDYNINVLFINALQNHNNFILNYHGYGEINNRINNHLEKNNIGNVFLTGKYDRENEIGLYLKSDIINVLIPNDDINSKTLMPNRLYNAAIIGKPVIVYEGSFVAEQVEKYSLGIVIKSFNNLDDQIEEYLSKFDNSKYNTGREEFLFNATKDNNYFKKKLLEFLYY